MPVRKRPERDFTKEILRAGPVEWTMSSKSNRFAPLKFTLGADPKSASGYRVYAEPVTGPDDSSSSASASTSASTSGSTSSSGTAFSSSSYSTAASSITLPEIVCTGSSELSALASDWSGESAAAEQENQVVPMSSPPTDSTDATGKGKGKASDVPPRGDLQPHYRSMLDV